MTFLTLLEAQSFAVQRVIERRTLENALSLAQTQAEQNAIKPQIRSVQWQLDQANKFIVLNSKTALPYSLDMFTVDNLVKTNWDNEKDIPNTQLYAVNSQATPDYSQIQSTNKSILAEIDVLISETDALLKENKSKLLKARELPLNSEERLTAVADSKDSILKLSEQLNNLYNQRNVLLGVSLELPSNTVQTENTFSNKIREELLNSLKAKPGYIEQEGDVDAALNMRKLALDDYYTAKTTLEKTSALERLNRVYVALSPSVPLTRSSIAEENLFLDKKINDIAQYNIVLEPKSTRLSVSQLAYAAARDSGIQADIAATKAEYENANADYETTLHEIIKVYDSILGYQKTYGSKSMFPGSLESFKKDYIPPQDLSLDANGNPKSYPLIWDTKDEKFVSQTDVKADPSRYLATAYTNRPVTELSTDAEKMQSILSQRYRETAVAEAEYQYKKDTSQLFFENENRASKIADTQKDLNKLDQEWSVKSVSGKVTDDDFLKYQQERQVLQASIKEDNRVITDNSAKIYDAQAARDTAKNPFSVLQQTQVAAQEYTDGTNRKVATIAPTSQTSKIATDNNTLNDAKSETIIAERQFNTASEKYDQARNTAIQNAIASGVSEKDAKSGIGWSPTDTATVNDYKTKKTAADNTLTDARKSEIAAAKEVKAVLDNIDKMNISQEEKQKLISQMGINQEDVDKIISKENTNYLLEMATEKERLQEEIRNNLSLKYQDAYENSVKATANVAKVQSELDSINKSIAEQNAIINNPLSTDAAKAEAQAKLKELQTQATNKTKELDKAKKEEDTAKKNADDALAATDDANIEKLANAQYDTNEARKLDLANNGFEGLNNNAPFYMQFPTLNSITDFKLRNGVDPYGEKSTDEIARDAVVFKIFETVPGVNKAETVVLDNGAKFIRNVPEKTNIQTLGSFTIYPSHADGKGDWLTQSHNHTWKAGEQDMVTQVLQTGLDAASTVESLLRLSSAGLDSIQRGSLHGSSMGGNSYQRKIDVIDYYQSTEKSSMAVEFSLFTKNNFLNDVFRPIMFLTALGYPKRSMNGDLGKLIDKNLTQGLEVLQQKYPDAAISKIVQGVLEKLKNAGIGQSVDEIEQALSKFGGLGPYRYYVSKRPEYMSVRHASGLFYFPVAYISSFEYTYKGPWYNYSGEPLGTTKDLDILLKVKADELAANTHEKTFKEKMNETFTNFATNVRETFKSPPKVPRPEAPPEKRFQSQVKNGLLNLSDSDAKYLRKYGLPFAYPSWATCKITFRNAVPFFRDDFMGMYYSSEGDDRGESLVTLTQQQTNQEQFASGGRKSKDNLIDKAYKNKSK